MYIHQIQKCNKWNQTKSEIWPLKKDKTHMGKYWAWKTQTSGFFSHVIFFYWRKASKETSFKSQMPHYCTPSLHEPNTSPLCSFERILKWFWAHKTRQIIAHHTHVVADIQQQANFQRNFPKTPKKKKKSNAFIEILLKLNSRSFFKKIYVFVDLMNKAKSLLGH